MQQTEGHLLGGRVRYAQPAQGYRSGIEPVLLAASIPARAGDLVLEGGSGAGATLLCLAARVPDLRGLGIELDPALAHFAQANAAANRWTDLHFVAGDIATLPVKTPLDHACANPPYHDISGTPSPYASRRAAKQATASTMAVWAGALARQLRPGGTLTFILPASLLPAATSAFTTFGCAPEAVLPLWPKSGVPAKLLLLRGIKGSHAPMRLLPGLVLHQMSGYTAEAERVLRRGEALEL